MRKMNLKCFLVNKKTYINVIYMFISIIVVVAGVTANIPIPYFKYPYLFLVMLLIILAIIYLFINKKIPTFIKENWLFLSFGIYLCCIVTSKHILMFLEKNSEMSLLTGYGEVLYILFGLFFFNVYSEKKILLFMKSYVYTFVVAFLIYGKNTLYDYGNICRTIGVYENPNTLALYACVALYFSLFLYRYAKKKLKAIYFVTASVSVASIINTTSRAMYLAVAASSVFFLFTLFIKKYKRKYEWKNVIIKDSLSLCVFVLTVAFFVILYYPKAENATVDATKDEIEQVLESQMNRESQTNNKGENHKNIYNRIFGKEQSTVGASVKNNTRFDIWKEYLKNIKEYFLWGNREGNDALFFEDYDRMYVPHNIFLSVFYKYGFIGLILFCFVLLIPAVTVLKERQINMGQCILFMGMCALLIYGLLHEATNTGIFWSMIGLLNNYQKLEIYSTERNERVILCKHE